MKPNAKKILFYFLSILICIPAMLFAQENEIEMADAMRSNGKIYVVISVVSIILAGLLLYLISIDRRVRQMENERKKS